MTKIHLQASVPETLNNQRLDQALAKLFPDYSRNRLQQWIQAEQVYLDNQPCTQQRKKVYTDQQIEINTELMTQERSQAQAIPLDIIYEDEALIIINKPAGLVVHPGAGNPDQTLVNALLHFDPTLDELPRAGIVHRLDKDTTGLLVVARNLATHHYLVDALQQRKISREYEAIVHGVIVAGGEIDAPIGRHPKHRTQMSVVQSGKPAVTHYRVIKRFPNHTHIHLKLESGRTHQIRVHLKHIHYPIVGDPIYGNPNLNHLLPFPRQALHAIQLRFIHPLTQQPVGWNAPLPDDMTRLLKQLQ